MRRGSLVLPLVFLGLPSELFELSANSLPDFPGSLACPDTDVFPKTGGPFADRRRRLHGHVGAADAVSLALVPRAIVSACSLGELTSHAPRRTGVEWQVRAWFTTALGAAPGG